MRNPNLCSLLCCPVPCPLDDTPVLCTSASAASPHGRVCLVFGELLFYLYYCSSCFCPPISAFPWVSCVVLAPPAGHKNAGLVFRALCRCSLLFFSFLFFRPFRLVLSCRPSVGLSPGHIIELIVPVNSNLVPSGLGLRLAPMHDYFLLRLSFLSLIFFFFCPFLPFFV